MSQWQRSGTSSAWAQAAAARMSAAGREASPTRDSAGWAGPVRAPAWWMPALIVACGALGYSSSFAGAFLFDDVAHIVVNRALDTLWPPTRPMGESFRPLFFYSLAVNRAVSGISPWSYHLVNLLVHLGAALALFGIVRRTIVIAGAPAWRAAADGLALAVALLWGVHPLTTQAVTYVVQRSESMAALFYLLTLYCFVRALQGGRRGLWLAATVASLLLSLGSKETAVTAPVLLLLYDRCFGAGSFRAAVRQRWPFYAAFVAVPPAVLLARWAAGMPNHFFFAHAWAGLSSQRLVPVPGGFTYAPLASGAVAAPQYLMTQAEVLLHYLRLAVWPAPLVFDYAWRPAAGLADVLAALVVVGFMLVATAWALWRLPALGFLGASFFLLLVITSSVIPLPDAAVEHRMYLPLAVPVALAVIGVWWGCQRWGVRGGRPARLPAAALALLVALLCSLTFARNFDYDSDARMWADVVTKRPGNARARYNLGTLLAEAGRLDDAATLFEQALAIDPRYVSPHVNLGMVRQRQGRLQEARAHYETALALRPDDPSAHHNLGTLWALEGRWRQATRHFDRAVLRIHRYAESEYLRRPLLAHAFTNAAAARMELGELAAARRDAERALRYDPDFAPAHAVRGRALAAAGELEAALAAHRRALHIDPLRAASYHGMAEALASLDRRAEALDARVRAVRLAPLDSRYRIDLGMALAAAGDPAGAERCYREALALDPASARAYDGLGQLLAARGDGEAAIRAFQKAGAVEAGYAAAHDHLGTTLADLGRHDEAVVAYLQALFVDPGFARAHNNLAVALWRTGEVDEAISHFREALRLQPGYPQARDNLDKLLGQR